MSRSSGSPIVDSVRGPILEWFTGKARQDAAEALNLLAASEADQQWLPGASRRVAAALGKSNVARKLSKRYGAQLEAIGDYTVPRDQSGWAVNFLLQFGNWKRGGDIDFEAVRCNAPTEEIARVVDLAQSFVQTFALIAGLIVVLDATRPAPTFTSIGASPTITNLLRSLGLVLNTSSIRIPPIEWEVVERLGKDGKPILVKVGRIRWPHGTVHYASRYAMGTHRNVQCHACGHAIQNPYNWVPLLLDSDDGVPHSLWVGRDCAKTLFGIRVTGDVELEDPSA